MMLWVENALSEGTDVAGVLKIGVAGALSSGTQNRSSAQNGSMLLE